MNNILVWDIPLVIVYSMVPLYSWEYGSILVGTHKNRIFRKILRATVMANNRHIHDTSHNWMNWSCGLLSVGHGFMKLPCSLLGFLQCSTKERSSQWYVPADMGFASDSNLKSHKLIGSGTVFEQQSYSRRVESSGLVNGNGNIDLGKPYNWWLRLAFPVDFFYMSQPSDEWM